MSNDYFENTPLTPNTVARAADINTRFAGVETGFELLPPPDQISENRITYSDDSGAANAYVATPAIPILAYNEGLRITLKAANSNTGASTINVSGLGVKQILRADGTVLQLNDIVAGQILDLNYDGTAFRLSLAFADISPAGVMAKIAAGGDMVVNGDVEADSLTLGATTIDTVTAYGASLLETANSSALLATLGLGTMAEEDAANYVTTSANTTALALKAPLASPTFTGVPAGPTATVGTDTTQLATTAFVRAEIAAGGGAYAPINSPTLTGTPLAPTAATATNTTQIATTAYVQANLANYTTTTTLGTTYAPLASPTFTGVPAAPTAAPGTNTTQVATTAFVTAAVAAGGGGGYAPLNSPTFTGSPTAPTPTTGNDSTLIATTAFVKAQGYATLASPALTGTPTAPTQTTGNNTTRIATTAFVQQEMGTFAPLASPAFTGNPTAPTQTAGNNTTRLATTAFVQDAISAKASAFMTVTSFTSTRTITDNDVNSLLRFTGGTTRTITMNSTPTAGFSCILANRGSVNLTLSAASGAYLNGAGSTDTSITLAPSGKVTLVHEGSGIWTVDGTGAT